MSRLTPEAVRSVLARAEEIQLQAGATTSQDEIELVVRAATEAGLSEAAVMQALRERLSLVSDTLAPGHRVFAKSADGYFYPALIDSVHEMTATVKFIAGGEAMVARGDLRPMNLMPGQKVYCPWKDWGWWNCTIVGFNTLTDELEVSDGWGETAKFKVSEVRLSRNEGLPHVSFYLKFKWWAAMAAGTVLGSAGMWWFLHR